MKQMRRMIAFLLVVFSLSGCGMDLYTGLSEGEANQMLALLMLHQIKAEKQPEKGGTVGLSVDKSQFINAVELLRQHGFPRQRFASVDELFPSNQLVTSPGQEQAKMVYLKEQQLESMLSHMDGVIRADVTIAMPAPTDGKSSVPHAASVFIKYSPEVNLLSYQPQIKNLIRDGIPGIDYSQISVVMQPTNYRFTASTPQQQSRAEVSLQWLLRHAGTLQIVLGLLLAGLVGLSAVCWLRYLRR
ncbi:MULTISPECIES: EscJ/YscJ/HrcJ family type III secretion inner membrane ring protein SsaJ [Yersinia]|uniref:EscJ/YscJ/HrcJ family type III secretion inner membrane ring protein SsaJ n=1 Tax=Yersinia TaxID=629 RepID=UPI0005E352D4|nr:MULTISPECIES: EscJ/YscJ/HrcJ family type III secretion inner membrane ring protein SsaJ [Yersinia]OVZ95768.1 EscJ/YscJ/HrcJ family type III secretion inner membrane ring protein [Yersinia frederiksenii]RXA94351.1 EscJ/YscJ/HrcJ family type III secretion inner membrane ring protein SsaJ [Yersinia sp. 2105 StPb PI]CNI63408.1 type III secretion system apparatus lipoprotein [Yersinia frederiksenii]CNJ25015.1 type III secretion system apparatus lipoprotein [Yersinia frederiksenii]CNK66579.1 type